MSFDVGVHLWFDEPAEDRWPGLFGACLDASLAPVAPNLRLPLETPVKLSVCERSDNNLLWYRTAAAGECAHVVTHLHSFKGPHYIFHAELAFPCALYSTNDHRLERTVHPLDLRLSGPDADAQGYEFKRKGLISFGFSNVKVFGIPPELIEHSRAAVESGQQDPYMATITEISRNFDVISTLCRRLITGLDPAHLVVCTEAEVHPLTAHCIYHRDIADFQTDLDWIARLHDEGGLYLCAGDSREFSRSRGETQDYGYLRTQWHPPTELLAKLESRLHGYATRARRVRLAREDIVEALTLCPSAEIEPLRDSIILCAQERPYAYIEDAYIELFDRVIARGNAAVH